MKKLMIAILLIMICTSVFSQQTQNTNPLTKQDYLQKSKNQKIAAWALLGGGAALTAGGLIWFGNEFEINLYEEDDSGDSGEGGIILAGIGVAAMGGSIPLFVASVRNKNKAMKMNANIKMEKAGTFNQTGFVSRPYPAVSFRLNFK